MGVGGKRHAPAALPSCKSHGTNCIGSSVGPGTGLGGNEETTSCPHQSLNAETSGPWTVVIPITCGGVFSNSQALSKKFQQATIKFVTRVCLHVCPHGTTRLPLDGVPSDFIWQVFTTLPAYRNNYKV
jgi:hypothetical protein